MHLMLLMRKDARLSFSPYFLRLHRRLSSPSMPSVGFNEPALGCPPLLNGSPSLTYSACEPAIFSRAATGLALFHGKKSYQCACGWCGNVTGTLCQVEIAFDPERAPQMCGHSFPRLRSLLACGQTQSCVDRL